MSMISTSSRWALQFHSTRTTFSIFQAVVQNLHGCYSWRHELTETYRWFIWTVLFIEFNFMQISSNISQISLSSPFYQLYSRSFINNALSEKLFLLYGKRRSNGKWKLLLNFSERTKTGSIFIVIYKFHFLPKCEKKSTLSFLCLETDPSGPDFKTLNSKKS